MALDINGYNATFKAFTDFAAKSIEAGEKKAIARADGTGGLANRTIQPASGDWVGKIRRSNESRDANNIARGLFKQAIIDMFGGEKNIPKSVLDAMRMQDFNKGKPLTARRIIAVKTAIDATGVMKQKGTEEVLLTAALAKGYAKGEMPKLAKAANLLAQTKGCSVEQAFEEVATPGSKANRLINYGGRFMQSADNFKNGLRLLDSFNSWFDETGEALKKIHPTPLEAHFEEGMSKTLLNGWETMFRAEYKIPVERFVFEEIANNPAVNLAEKNANKLFSMENNQAMGSIARNMLFGRTQTVAQIPPEKRATFFKALNTICPLVSSAGEARIPRSQRHAIKGRNLDAPVARLLKNLDALIALDSQKKLTAKNLVKLCFPEIKKPSADPASDVVDLVNQWDDDINGNGDECKYPREDCAAMNEAMKATGCSEEEAVQIAKGNLQLPNVPYFSSGTLGLHEGMAAARNQLIGDLDRGIGYNYTGGEPLLKTAGFRFNLPGGESLFANKTPEFKGNIPVIADKLEALCGPAHKAQATSLFMMTCQSGLGPLLGGLKSYGVESTEHSSVDFTITKNNDSGDISIRYTSPKELPFSFEWTATIKPDGYVSSTPIRFTDETTLKNELSSLADTIKNARGIKSLPPAEQDRVAGIFLEHARSDSDLIALLKMNEGYAVFDIAVDGASHVRSDAKIIKHLELLKANVDELRTATNGDKRAFDMGLKQLASLAGTGLKPGMITQMAQLAAKEDVVSLKGVDASSSPDKIFEKMCKFDRMVNNIVVNTKVLQSFDGDPASIDSPGATEAATAIGMAQALLLARCDNKTLQGLRDALHSVNTRKMMQALDQIGNGAFPPGSRIDPQVRIVMSEQVAPTMRQELRMHMTDIVNDALGIEEEGLGAQEPKEYETADAKSFAKIVNLLEEHTTQVFSSRIELANANPLRQIN